jgi:hypothetical protein
MVDLKTVQESHLGKKVNRRADKFRSVENGELRYRRYEVQ